MNIAKSSEHTFSGERQRLDTFVAQLHTEYTRSYWANMIKHGYVLVDGKQQKSGFKLSKGEEIVISWPKVTKDFKDKIAILYEDSNVIAIDKPAGMLVHSKGDFNPEYTVSDFAAEHSTEGADDSNRTGIVHRLDRYTSGVMIIAKNNESLAFLQKQFAERKTKKLYIAICEGRFGEDDIKIDVPLARSRKNPKTFMPDQTGKQAITNVSIINNDQLSIVALRPETGRTHQLRSHLSYINHPILGDVQYGAKALKENGRFMLHASRLQIEIETERSMTFTAEVPDDMTSYIEDEVADEVAKLAV